MDREKLINKTKQNKSKTKLKDIPSYHDDAGRCTCSNAMAMQMQSAHTNQSSKIKQGKPHITIHCKEAWADPACSQWGPMPPLNFDIPLQILDFHH